MDRRQFKQARVPCAIFPAGRCPAGRYGIQEGINGLPSPLEIDTGWLLVMLEPAETLSWVGTPSVLRAPVPRS